VDANRIKGITLVLAASALWGASGPLTKILRLDGFGITDILSWRYLIGFLSLTAFSTALSKPPTFRIGSARFRAALVMALCIFGVNAAFTWSNFFTTVANAIALSFTAPLFAAVLAWVFLGEKVRASHQAAIGIGFAGVCIFVFGAYAGDAGTPTALSPNIPLGNGLALLSGLLFGWYFVIARKFAQRDGEVMTGTTWQFLILSILLLPLMPLTLFKGIAGVGYLHLVVYSVLCTAAPILMLNLSSLYLKAHETSILALSEVPFSILIGILMVREFPSLVSWTGVAFILTAGFLAAIRQGRD
jgi:drug/metabolite transporter (DMT)-like permease